MNPASLVAPSSPLGFPAPYWFLVFFKVVGFTLHMTMMNLWYAGPIIALILYWRGGHARTLTNHIMAKLPIVVAYGVNFGIVPLLFIQVAYHKVFYPSSILMAWPWISIIVLLTFAYYGIYIYATALKDNEARMNRYKRAAGWIAAVLFIIIGFIFSNEFSLMTNLGAWPSLWQNSNFAGAVTGTALNTGDATFWPRWLMMFGLAITTTAAFSGLDAGLFSKRESDDYKQWVSRFAYKPYIFGIIWYGSCAAWYIWGTWGNDIKQIMFSGTTSILTLLTAISPLMVLIILFWGARKKQISKRLGIIIGLSQFIVLSLNAVSRQVVQNVELSRYFDITAENVQTQWSPMILFVVLFIAGIGLIIWMINQAVKSSH
jgi:hypothetical protein